MSSLKFSYLIMNLVLLLSLIGFIKIIFNLHRFFFVAELLFLGVIMLITLISMVSVFNDIKFGWTLLSFVFGLVLLDLLFIYLVNPNSSSLFLLTGVLGLVGFIVSIANTSSDPVNHEHEPEPVEEKPVKAQTKNIKVKKVRTMSKKVAKKVKRVYKPGKFVASKLGVRYHAPKCFWAKKINRKNAVWYNSTAAAKKAGFKPDVCVK